MDNIVEYIKGTFTKAKSNFTGEEIAKSIIVGILVLVTPKILGSAIAFAAILWVFYQSNGE